MWFERRRQVLGVRTWLDIACFGLCDTAKIGIAEEVLDHFNDAQEAALARRLSQRDAAQEALASLGDPYEARKGFRRVHLTESEERWIDPARGRTGLMKLTWLCAAIAWCQWLAFDPTFPGIGEPMFIMFVAWILWFRCVPNRPDRIAVYLVFIVTFVMLVLTTGSISSWAQLVFILYYAAMEMLIQQKLNRTAKHG